MRRTFQFGAIVATNSNPNPASEAALDHGSLIETITGVTVSLVPLTALMQQFMSRSDLIKDSEVSFGDMTRVQMDICVRLYAQAYHRYTSLSLDSVAGSVY